MSTSEVGRFDALGSTFSISTNDPAAGRLISRRLTHLRTSRAPADRYEHLVNRDNAGRATSHSLLLNGRLIFRTASGPLLVSRLLWHCNRAAIEQSFEHLLFHAATVVADGGGILLPGRPGSGKSTLSAGLVMAGMAYGSDEVGALVLGEGRFVGYPKPIMLDPIGPLALPEVHSVDEAEYVAGEHAVDPVLLGGRVATEPFRIQLMIQPRFVAGAGCEVTELTAGEALLTLSENAFNAGMFGVEAVHAMADLALGVPCFLVQYGTIADAVAVVLELVGQDRSAVPMLSGPPPRRAPMNPVRPAPGVRLVRLDQEGVLFDEHVGTLHFLNPSAVAVWELLDGERPVQEIARIVAVSVEETEATLRDQIETLVLQFHRTGLVCDG